MDLITAIVVSPSPRRAARRLLLSTLAGVGGGLAVGAPLGCWAAVASQGPGFLAGLVETMVAVGVSVLVGVAVAVLTLRAASRTDPARRRLVLAYAPTFVGAILSVGTAVAPPLLVVVPLVVVRRLRLRWLVVTLGAIGVGVAVVFLLVQHRQRTQALGAYAGPVISVTPPGPYVLDTLSPPSSFDGSRQAAAGRAGTAGRPAGTARLYESSSTYWWLCDDSEVDVGGMDGRPS